MALPVAAMLAPALLKAGLGAWQMFKGGQFAKEKRPEYEIPESAKQSLGIAESLATQRELPGQSILEDKMRSATAGGISRMAEVSDSPAAMLGNISKMVANENQAKNQLGVNAATYYQQNQRNLQGALDRFGQYELQKWNYDQAKPYDEAMHAAAMMREGGMQNIVGGVASGISGLISSDQNKEYMELLKSIYAKKEEDDEEDDEAGKAFADLFKGLSDVTNIKSGNLEDVFRKGLTGVDNLESPFASNAAGLNTNALGGLNVEGALNTVFGINNTQQLGTEAVNTATGGVDFMKSVLGGQMPQVPLGAGSMSEIEAAKPQVDLEGLLNKVKAEVSKEEINTMNSIFQAAMPVSQQQAQAIKEGDFFGEIFKGGEGAGSATGEVLGNDVELTIDKAKTFSNEEIYERLNLSHGGAYNGFNRDKGASTDGKTPSEIPLLSKEEALKLLNDPDIKQQALKDLVTKWNEAKLYQMMWNEK